MNDQKRKRKLGVLRAPVVKYFEPQMDTDETQMDEQILSLTLTLSRWEREWPTRVLNVSEDHLANTGIVFSSHRRMILPLPAGEGMGEGESFK